ncbi:uncharacterized protein TNCT_250221 [Trichonephila clavata]|uniref:Uncharacterized protein n=1 Tax=Trichonephila clavata TaxID=2740835 RepID=A0A8X6KMN6_TRICU|nr:uncharacterized protein TNCT_250221 [Trichonephila clavata]
MLTDYTSQNPEDMKKLVSMGYLESIAVDHQSLVPVTKLKSFFRHAKTFTEFKANYLQTIPDEYWINTLHENPRVMPYIRRYLSTSPPSSRSPSPRRRLKMKAFVGPARMSDVSDDESVISIDPLNDECDNTNVNLPKPLCQGIRRVCRYYDKDRRYRPYDRDSSENDQYAFNLSYS